MHMHMHMHTCAFSVLQGEAMSTDETVPPASEAWRYWRSMADVMALLVPQQPLPGVESAQDQVARLQLPALDPRASHAGISASERDHVQAKLTEFLHVLYCVVEGVDAHLGCDLVPDHCLLRPCMEYLGGANHQRRVYRHGSTWRRVFEREYSGPWPTWWARDKHGPWQAWCIKERTLLQLKVLLARMVLNDNSLAIDALCSCQSDPELHTLSLEYAATVHYSHCLRCQQPYTLLSTTYETGDDTIISATVERWVQILVGKHISYTEENLRREYSKKLEEIEQQRPGYWRPHVCLHTGEVDSTKKKYIFINQCEHGQTQSGFPVRYICRISPIAAHLFSPAITTSLGGTHDVNGKPKDYQSHPFFSLTIDIDFSDEQRVQFNALPPLADAQLVQNGVHMSNELRCDRLVSNPQCANGRRLRQRASGGTAMLRAPISQFEQLLKWAESRAQSFGVSPPYAHEGFVPAQVVHQSRTSSSGDDTVHDEVLQDTLELPPLAAEYKDNHDEYDAFGHADDDLGPEPDDF